MTMDAASVTFLREVLSATWVEGTARLGRALRSTRSPGGLLVVGTPGYDPWHLAAHLDDEARLSGLSQLAPTLVRWSPPPGAPPHLSVGLERIEAARRGETVFVVAEEQAPAALLERVDDARRTGTTILALDGGDRELQGLAHDALTVPPAAPLSFDAAQHLVSVAAGERPRRRGLRARLARLADLVTGPRVPD
jgi:hypothetical protein